MFVQLSQIWRLKWGITETSRSAGWARQKLSSKRTNGRWNERIAVCSTRRRLLLDADSGELAQQVEPVRQVLKLDELDLPVALLFGNDGLQGHGGIAMSATAVVENDVYSFHWPRFWHREWAFDQSTLHAMWISY